MLDILICFGFPSTFDTCRPIPSLIDTPCLVHYGLERAEKHDTSIVCFSSKLEEFVPVWGGWWIREVIDRVVESVLRSIFIHKVFHLSFEGLANTDLRLTHAFLF